MVLNGQGRVLDTGREQRPFPLRLRRAVAARDGGCAATSVDNGVLLCSHHHHAVHAGAWSIENRQGVPWFIPAAYLDPARTAQRNVFWRS
ncbi:HNH endonuclease [Micrococcus terreus]|uniref:HNH endonuclease n=1 Tax=Micrococcus terreus TaxID=574650 RepID=UPI0033F870B4